jgi:hypothetical protein
VEAVGSSGKITDKEKAWREQKGPTAGRGAEEGPEGLAVRY